MDDDRSNAKAVDNDYEDNLKVEVGAPWNRFKAKT